MNSLTGTTETGSTLDRRPGDGRAPLGEPGRGENWANGSALVGQTALAFLIGLLVWVATTALLLSFLHLWDGPVSAPEPAPWVEPRSEWRFDAESRVGVPSPVEESPGELTVRR